ncbi:MAG: fibronectin type III domain-containing protein, partial [Bacteroidia bacterium]|nr:fibronectin type III domain-containing protein [Bacteroidia bacterium]
QLRLYTQAIGGRSQTQLNAPPFEFTLGPISNSTIFYLASAKDDCESVRIPFSVIINTPPSAPTSANVSRCGVGEVVFTVTSQDAANTMRLYDTSNNLLATDTLAPFELPARVTQTQTFYIRAFNSRTNCLGDATAVVATVNPALGLATPHLSKYQLCHPSILTISVHADSPQGTELRLYDSTSPNTIFSRSSTLGLITTPFISQSKTFYLEQYSSITGCSSSSRTPVEVTVHPPISEPIVLTNPITLGCGGGSVVNILAQMGSNRGNEMRLYTTPTGGSFVYSTSTSPYVLRTYPVSTNDMVFYFVAAANSQTGCESERVGVIIRTVSSPPSVPIASNVIICNNNPQVNPVFTASMGNIIGTEIRLYTQSTGGNPIVSATNIPYQLTAPPITTHTTFYIAAAIGNCESQRAEVVATIGRLPNLPTVQNIFRCPSGPVTFTVIPGSGPIPTEAIRMYDSNQNLIKEDNNLSYIFSVNLSTTTTFFFSARNGVCETERVQAVAILDRPTEPSVNNVVRCGSGKVTFSATYQGNVPISEIRLFEQNGTYLGSDSNEPYEIETTVSTTTTFTIIAYARNGNCQSRPVQVVGRVEPPLPAPNISSVVHQCGNNPGIVSVSLPPSAALRVYNSLSSGSPIHSFPEGTNTIRLPEGVYFLASAKEGCESDRVRLIIRSAIVPASPTVNNISYCENTHVSFTAQMGTPAGNRILLYTQELGGTAIATATTGPNYILSPPNPISRIATYYLAVASQDCESPRIPVTATPTPNFLPPTLSSNTIHLCNTSQVSFTVNVGNQAVERVYLYTVASGGLPVSTASTFPYVLTTSVTTSTTLYVESAGSENRCRSIRIPVLVNFDTPEPPIVPSTITNCGPGNVKIEASIQSNRGGNEVRLYPRPVGVGFISSDNTAPFELVVNVTTTTTFYLATARSGTNCESERIPVEIKIVPIPSIPTVVPDNIILCQGGTFTITVNQGPIPGNEVRLYTSENSEDPVEGTTFPPYVITYYVDNTSDFFVATNNNIEGCESPRKKITVQMGPKISTSITAANCQQSGSINVQTNEGSGNFSYSLTNINGNTITSSNVNFNNLRPGSYALTVRDISYNCIINQNIEIQAQVPSPQPWVNNVMGTSATINWNSIPGAESYIVRYRDDNGNFSEITINASNTFVIIPTTPNRNYTVQVRAICASGIDSPFGNVSFQSSSMGTPLHCSQVKRGFCSTPEDLRVEINSPTSATFRWTPNLDGQGSAVCYVIRYGIAGQNNWTLQVVPHPNCELQVTNLIPGQTYEVQIRTNCQNCFTNVGSLTHYSSSVSFTMPYSRQEIENSINSSLGDYLKVYPNPSMGLFYVEFFTPEPTQEGQIKITDAWGKIVLEQTIPIEEGQNQITLNLDNKAAGIYFLELQQGNTKKTARLIKQ